MKHFPITQAGLIAAATAIIGQVVAFVPAWGPEKQLLVSITSGLIAVGFLIANAIHAFAASKQPSLADLEHSAENLVESKLADVNFNQLAHDALAGRNIGQIVSDEVRKILSAATRPAPTPVAPVAPAAVVSSPAAPAVPPGA